MTMEVDDAPGRFMELASITSTNLDDHGIEFPELYEIST
jgi:hypothetical protein